MRHKGRAASTETFILRSAETSEAAEKMARASKGNEQARAAYSRLLVEQSKSFGTYVSEKIARESRKAAS